MEPHGRQNTTAGHRRRWFLGFEPVFEGGRHGRRAQAWDVEDELVAVALLGDVTIDLSQTRSAPAEIDINAYAIVRDVNVLVAEGTHVEMFGGVWHGDLNNDVPAVPEERRDRVVRVHGHTVAGDVTARLASGQRPTERHVRPRRWAHFASRRGSERATESTGPEPAQAPPQGT